MSEYRTPAAEMIAEASEYQRKLDADAAEETAKLKAMLARPPAASEAETRVPVPVPGPNERRPLGRARIQNDLAGIDENILVYEPNEGLCRKLERIEVELLGSVHLADEGQSEYPNLAAAYRRAVWTLIACCTDWKAPPSGPGPDEVTLARLVMLRWNKIQYEPGDAGGRFAYFRALANRCVDYLESELKRRDYDPDARPNDALLGVLGIAPTDKAERREAPRPADRPRWDKQEKTLSFRNTVCAKFRKLNSNYQVELLDAFESAGWPQAITNPLGDEERFIQTVKALKKTLRDGSMIDFDRDNQKIKWMVRGKPPVSPR